MGTKKIVSVSASKISGERLTRVIDTPFCIVFRRKLYLGYTFDELEKVHLKAFQGFLDKVSSMTFSEVERMYSCEQDKKDRDSSGEPIQHYRINEKFRIHGVNTNGAFEVLRLDPSHNVHR